MADPQKSDTSHTVCSTYANVDPEMNDRMQAGTVHRFSAVE